MSKGDRTVNINFRGGSGGGGQKSGYPSSSRSHGSSHDGRAKSSPHAEQHAPVGLVSHEIGGSGAAQAQQLVVQALEAQRVKEANEAYAAQQAKIQQEREAAGIAHKLQLAKDFEATPLGIATIKLQQAEEIYAAKVEQYKNVPRNFNYHEDRVITARQVDQAAKRVETMKAIRAKTEAEDAHNRWVAVERIKYLTKLSQEDQAFLTERYARIDLTKEKLYEVELNPREHKSLEVKEYSPLIIETLKQYSRDYDGFNKQIISYTIPIQALRTLSLKKNKISRFTCSKFGF